MATTDILLLEDLPSWLGAYADQLAHVDLTEPLTTAAFYLAQEARKCFDEQRSPDGAPWAGWKRPPSAKRGGPASKLLRNTDVLMASLAGKGQGHIESVMSASMVWGTAVGYAAYHQYGTRTIPARPFIGVTDAMLEKIDQIVLDYLLRTLKAANPGSGAVAQSPPPTPWAGSRP